MYNTNQLANHRRKAVIAAITCFIVIVVLVLVAWAIISAISGSNKFNNSPIGVDDPASSSNTSKKPSTNNTSNTSNSSSTSNKPQTNTTNNSSSNTSSSSTQNTQNTPSTQNTQTTSNTSTKPSTPVNTAPITSAPEENIPTTGPADHLVAILALGVATALGVRLYQSRQNRLLFD